MKIDGKRIRFAKELWVQTGGVKTVESSSERIVEGIDENSYVKVLNHFGRALKLFTFEDGRWMDSETGLESTGFDERIAGRVPVGTGLPKSPRPSRGDAAQSAGKAKKGAARAAAKPKAGTAATSAKNAPAKKAPAKKAPAKKSPAKKGAAKKPPAKRGAAAGRSGASRAGASRAGGTRGARKASP